MLSTTSEPHYRLIPILCTQSIKTTEIWDDHAPPSAHFTFTTASQVLIKFYMMIFYWRLPQIFTVVFVM
jgi:hypothetical protein